MAYYSPQLMTEFLIRSMTEFNNSYYAVTSAMYHNYTSNNLNYKYMIGSHRSMIYTDSHLTNGDYFTTNYGHTRSYFGSTVGKGDHKHSTPFDPEELPDFSTMREGISPIMLKNGKIEFTMTGAFDTSLMKWMDQGDTLSTGMSWGQYAGYLGIRYLANRYSSATMYFYPLIRYTFQSKRKALPDLPENWKGHPYPDFKFEYDDTKPDRTTDIGSVTADITKLTCIAERFESDVESWAAMPTRTKQQDKF